VSSVSSIKALAVRLRFLLVGDKAGALEDEKYFKFERANTYGGEIIQLLIFSKR